MPDFETFEPTMAAAASGFQSPHDLYSKVKATVILPTLPAP